KTGAYADAYRALESQNETLFKEKEQTIRELVGALKTGDHASAVAIEKQLDLSQEQQNALRKQATDLMIRNDPAANTNDTNYIFLNFVIHYLPVGLVGLVIAAIFAASMSSTSAELNSLASTTVVDVYKRMVNKNASEKQYVVVSKLATVMWGIFAIIFAEYANRLGSLIEAVNILGSLFYGTILGIFLLAFYCKFVRGTAAFYAAILGEIAVVCCFMFTEISFLWYNVIGCLLTMGLALMFNLFIPKNTTHG
ncbi:sodium:solute symporter, partial [bacterium]|nr:sodium:solute symporter [bacterium]